MSVIARGAGFSDVLKKDVSLYNTNLVISYKRVFFCCNNVLYIVFKRYFRFIFGGSLNPALRAITLAAIVQFFKKANMFDPKRNRHGEGRKPSHGYTTRPLQGSEQFHQLTEWLRNLPKLFKLICSDAELGRLYDFQSQQWERTKRHSKPKFNQNENNARKRKEHFTEYGLVGENYPSGPCPECEVLTHSSSWVWKIKKTSELVKPMCRRCHKWRIRTHG